MKKYNPIKAFEELCKKSNKWGLYLNYDWNEENTADEIIKAAPFLTYDDLLDGNFIFLFDTEKECREHFDLVVGDDGPTVFNSYNGNIRIYALICDNKGCAITENT